MSYPSLSPAPTTNQPPRVAEISADDADAIKQEMNRLLASPVLPPKRTHRVSNSRITPGNPPVAEDSSVRGGSAFGGFGAGNKRTVERQRSTSRPRHPWSISDDAPDTSMLPPRQSTAAVTSVGGLIINALAEKKLQDAKKTKLEQMEERMTKRLNEAPTARGLALERAASKQLVGQNLGGMRVGWVEYLGDIWGWWQSNAAWVAYRVSKPIVESEDFDLLIISIIFVNCISLALFRPTELPGSEWNHTLEVLELSLNGIFTFELLMRCAYVVGRRRLPLSNPEFESANGFSA